jgi:Restriction endonuclease BglII
MSLDLLPDFIRTHYEVYEWKHACAILKQDFPQEWNEIVEVLMQFRLKKSWITVGGGRKSKVAEAFDSALGERGWKEKGFDTKVVVDDESLDSPTHKVDCFKNRVALEIEWNNKDPFFDRDLNNFRLLFELRVVSVGVVITRCDELQEIFDELGRGSSYGSSTTHMSKLLPRIQGGGGGGCPLLVLGIKKSLYVEDC